MKISHIIAIIIIAVSIGVIISTTGDASEYVSFHEAQEKAREGDADKVHVVGKLKKDHSGHIVGMVYSPVHDPNYFTFELIDNKGQAFPVVYYHPKPQDFEKSEQVVVVGGVKEGVFVASEILMKCPSKYENQEVKAQL